MRTNVSPRPGKDILDGFGSLRSFPPPLLTLLGSLRDTGVTGTRVGSQIPPARFLSDRCLYSSNLKY